MVIYSSTCRYNQSELNVAYIIHEIVISNCVICPLLVDKIYFILLATVEIQDYRNFTIRRNCPQYT